MRSFIIGCALIGFSFLLIWVFNIDVEDGKFGAGVASVPGIIGAWMIFAPIRRAIFGEE